jgi:hypothetical protein
MTDSDHLLSGPAAGTAPKHRWIRPTLIVLGVLIVAWLLFKWLYTPKAKPAVVPAIPVAAGTVKLGDINIYLDELGTVTPVYTVTVASRVAGELTEVRYKEGQIVKKNDLLGGHRSAPLRSARGAGTGPAGRATRRCSRTRASTSCAIRTPSRSTRYRSSSSRPNRLWSNRTKGP